jgi:hypothetical protein
VKKNIFSKNIVRASPSAVSSDINFVRTDVLDNRLFFLFEIRNGNCSTTFNHDEIVGRRIIKVKYFFVQIMSFKHSGNSCSNTDVFLHRERKRGLFSEFDMKCSKCENSLSFSTDEKGGASISVGGGYSQLTKRNATLNIPSMSRALYVKQMRR